MSQTESEGDDLLHRIADATPALIAHVDCDQRFVFVNSGYAEQFGRTPAEVVGQSVSLIIGEEYYAIVRPHLECALRGQHIQRQEFELRVPGTGVLRTMEATYVPHFGADRTITACTTLIFDITERKAADDALRTSEARLRHALDAGGAGVWEWDHDTGVITVDAAYRAMYGIAPDATVDMDTWEARLHPDDREPLRERVEECLRGGSQWREEFRVLHPQYGTRWLSGLGRVVRDAGGRIRGMTGINIDITTQKATEAAVAESEAHLKAVVEGAIDGIIAMDSDGAVQSLNTAAATMFGAAPEEIIGQNVRMLMPHLSAQNEFLPSGSSTTEAKTTGIIREVVGRHWDGSTFPLDLGITEVSREGQRLVIAIIRDITERKQTEETQRLLIDELNHRVKNTLVTVQAMAEQTLLKARDPTHFVESFRGRLQALSRAHNLLTQKTWIGVDLESLIREQLLVSGSQILTCAGPKIELKPRVAVHLGLALHELGTNARKYGALKVPEGKLSVTWHLADRGADPELELTWVESGGPAVSQPTGQGFGTLLIERGLKHSLGGEAHMKFTPTGVICKMRVPHCRSP